jgi:hypothetical protein
MTTASVALKRAADVQGNAVRWRMGRREAPPKPAMLLFVQGEASVDLGSPRRTPGSAPPTNRPARRSPRRRNRRCRLRCRSWPVADPVFAVRVCTCASGVVSGCGGSSEDDLLDRRCYNGRQRVHLGRHLKETIMPTTMQPVRLAVSFLNRPCHVCAFFHSKEEEYRVLMPFIKEGLRAAD